MYINNPIAPNELPRYGYVGKKEYFDVDREHLEGLEAQCLHTNSQTILQICVTTTSPGSDEYHRQYRSILQDPYDQIHIGRMYFVTDGDRRWLGNKTARGELPFWVDLHYDLRDALYQVDRFIPYGWRSDANTTAEIVDGGQKGLALWRLLTDGDRQGGRLHTIPLSNPVDSRVEASS